MLLFSLQSDLDNCREELEFTNHKNSELEKIVTVERENVKSLDGKLKVGVCLLQMQKKLFI